MAGARGEEEAAAGLAPPRNACDLTLHSPPPTSTGVRKGSGRSVAALDERFLNRDVLVHLADELPAILVLVARGALE